MTMSISGTSGLTFNDASTQNTAATGFGFKNRLINGAMVIDQRNAGASVTAGNTTYQIDRWRTELSGGGAFTVQQSTTAPAGFTNSAFITVTTADSSIAATDYYDYQQFIEGFNIADLGWGTANAQPVTLSFWVRSSVTGTFAGSFGNSAANRSYVFTYTVNSANTFEYKTVTILGDTSGTWLTTNGRGITLSFDLGNGSNYQAAAGSWVGQYAVGTSGSVKLISTLNATFYITGVQLEKGSTATSFDYRPYGTELALCQRYLPAVLSSGVNSSIFIGQWISASQALMLIPFNVPARVPPTGVTISALADISIRNSGGGSGGIATSISVANSNTQSAEFNMVGLTAGTGAGQAGVGYFISATGKILFTGCEL